MITIATSMMIVASTWTCGGRAMRAESNIAPRERDRRAGDERRDDVVVDAERQRQQEGGDDARAMIPGIVIFQNVRIGDDPRSIAASSSVQSVPRMRAFTRHRHEAEAEQRVGDDDRPESARRRPG